MKRTSGYAILFCLLLSSIVRPISEERAEQLSALTGVGVGFIVGGTLQRHMAYSVKKEHWEDREKEWTRYLNCLKEFDESRPERLPNKREQLLYERLEKLLKYNEKFGSEQTSDPWGLLQSVGVGVVCGTLAGTLAYKHIFSKLVDPKSREKQALERVFNVLTDDILLRDSVSSGEFSLYLKEFYKEDSCYLILAKKHLDGLLLELSSALGSLESMKQNINEYDVLHLKYARLTSLVESQRQKVYKYIQFIQDNSEEFNRQLELYTGYLVGTQEYGYHLGVI